MVMERLEYLLLFKILVFNYGSGQLVAKSKNMRPPFLGPLSTHCWLIVFKVLLSKQEKHSKKVYLSADVMEGVRSLYQHEVTASA